MHFTRHFCYSLLLSFAHIHAEPCAFVKESEFQPPSLGLPDAATLFQKLDANAIGLEIENPYDDPQMWAKRYRAYMGGGMGSGLAAGDFDGDGLVDLYVNPKTKPGKLFRNLGNWRFEDVTAHAGLEQKSVIGWLQQKLHAQSGVIWGQGAVFADVNNDGWLDLYVCFNDAPNRLYINQQDGTFSEQGDKRGLALVDGSVVGAFADYDRDGWLDVLVLTNQVDGTEASGRPDRLFHNEGNGFFKEVTLHSGITGETFGHSATWIDYNHDRWPDVYIANDFLGPDQFYRNNGDGTFTNVIHEVVPHTPYSSMGADLGDINNDGHFDMLIADMATTTREKDRRGLAASRGDILRAGTVQNASPQYMRSALLLNTGTGVFGEVACWAGVEATDWTWSIRFEDFDNDGWTDLHVTNGMVREANNSDMLSGMMRALTDQQRINVIKREPRLEESNLAFRNQLGNGFENCTQCWGLTDVGVSFGAATADYDNDGDLDIIYLNHNGGLSVFRNDCRDQHRIQVRLKGKQSNTRGIGAVVRLQTPSGWQSKPMTVSRGYASGSEMVAHFGLGSETTLQQLVVEWPSGVDQVFTDLKVDRAYEIQESDIPIGSPPTQQSPWFTENAEARGLAFTDPSELTIPDREQPFIPFRTDRAGPAVCIADLDLQADQMEEIYISATPGAPARLFRQQNGTYQSVELLGISTSAVEDGPPLFVDIDGDRDLDLLVTKAAADIRHWPGGYQPVFYENLGDFHFRPTQWLPNMPVHAGAVAMADLDSDGDLDLFIGARSLPGHYPETPQSFLLENRDGRFESITDRLPSQGAIGMIKSALCVDVDRDGAQDLLLALEWDSVRYFHNDGKGTFADWTDKAGFTSGGRGWWNSLAAADLNGDGQLDFAAGNLGLNTTYEASTPYPFTAFYGSFSASGTQHFIEAVYDHGELYPLKARNDLGTYLPKVLRQFPKNNRFAQATLQEVFGEKNLREATPYYVDNFSSGVFLSQPDGRYRFEAFPQMAQLGPIQGMVIQDMDCDGIADIVAVQNTDCAIPRFDGAFGLFLKGVSGGKFENIHPTRSGFVVPGNARSLTLLDSNRDGFPDLFTTRYSGDSALFEHLQHADAGYRSIRLVGAPENPLAIGSVITLVYPDSDPVSYPVTLGGGWYSQSTPRIFAARSKQHPLQRIEVRWPDGTLTNHESDEDSGGNEWVITAPVSRSMIDNSAPSFP